LFSSHKHCLDSSSFVLSAPFTCLKKPVFSKWDLLQRKVAASLSLFLKSEKKIPALIGKRLEYSSFRDFSPVPSAYQPQA
jgi:hypothetical protein